jgi:hypothetical protein
MATQKAQYLISFRREKSKALAFGFVLLLVLSDLFRKSTAVDIRRTNDTTDLFLGLDNRLFVLLFTVISISTSLPTPPFCLVISRVMPFASSSNVLITVEKWNMSLFLCRNNNLHFTVPPYFQNAHY